MKRTFWIPLTIILVAFVAAEAGAFLALHSAGLDQQPYTSVIINLAFLITCAGLVRGLGLNAQDLGLKLIPGRLRGHIALCLSIFLFYVAIYIFAVRISSLRPVTTETWWGLLNYLLVVFAEEIYFRGIAYRIIEKRFSGRWAVIGSAILFGLAHARQGLGMLPKFFSGFLWASVRYRTSMIYLLIIPVHFVYNVSWLLFVGNWDNPPFWAQFYSLVELAAGIGIITIFPKLSAKPSPYLGS